MSAIPPRAFALLVACGACTEPPAGDAEPAVEAPAAPVAATPTASSWHAGCIRGGATAAEVRAAIGEPDSIDQGWWIYGRTQIRFGYGTVQDWMDSSSVIVC